MKKYFIALDEMTLEEIDIWRLLCRHSNYDTDTTGYTVKQLVVNSDKRLNLTTQKVRTILKKFEKEGYIQPLSSGSKGKESTLKLTIKQQLFNNNITNKIEELQQIDELPNNNITTKQQQTNNTTKDKKKKDNNIIYSSVINYLNEKASTNYRASTKSTQGYINARVKEGYTVEDLRKVIDSKSQDWLGTKWEQYLRPSTLFNSDNFENYLVEANKKAPVGAGTNKNNLVNPSICRTNDKYSRGVEIL